jgi:putative membrane protein
MQAPGGPYQGPSGSQYAPGYGGQLRPRPHRWILVGVAILLGLIGTVLLLILLFPASFGYRAGTLGIGPFGFFGAFFLLFIFVLIILWVVRIAMWSSRTRGYGYYGRGYGGGRRYGAFAIARERYARGEISREQFDQIMQDLQRHPGYPPPP